MKITQSAGGVVLNADGLYLIVNQKGNSWSFPKGHLEAAESALEAARREIYEETGVRELELLGELGTYERPRIGLRGGNDPSEIKRITLFLFRTSQTTLEPQDPDHPEARWVREAQALALLTHEKDKRFFLDVIDKIKKLA